jgi:hypothetical protein
MREPVQLDRARQWHESIVWDGTLEVIRAEGVMLEQLSAARSLATASGAKAHQTIPPERTPVP